MSSILVVAVAAPSHLQPSLPLLRELAARGHHVRCAIDPVTAGLLAGTGVAPLELPTTLPGPGEAWPEDPVGGLGVFVDEAVALLPALEAALAGGPRPDLVLHDMAALAGPVLAARLGVPAVQLSPAAVAVPAAPGDEQEPAASPFADGEGAALMGRFAAWLAEQGTELTPLEVLSEPRRGLALIPRAMQEGAERAHARWSFVGPLLGPADAEGWTSPAPGLRVVLVAFGTAYTEQPAVHRAAVAGLARPGWHVVLALGDRTDPAALGPLAATGVEVHRTVPQRAVLAHADAFVTHAGMGSCAEALWFGVPAVAVPQAVDQPANAARLAALGVGVVLDAAAAADPVALRRAVDHVADDPEVRTRAAAVQAQVRAEGSAARAADLAEAELRRMEGV